MLRFSADRMQTNAAMRASALNVLEAHSISEPPVNIYQVLKDEQIEVDFWPFQNNIDGLFSKNVTGISIAINKYRHIFRQRFTAAHELKHHRHDVPQNGEMLPCSIDERVWIEQRANRFAGEFLVSQPMLQTVTKELNSQGLLTITTLSTVFCVSYEATVFRLHTEGYITDGQRDKLLSSSERQRDKKEAYDHRNSSMAAHLRTTAVVAALTGLDGIPYSNTCSHMILNDSWKVCYMCGSSLA